MHKPETGQRRSHSIYRLLSGVCLVLSLILFLSVAIYAYNLHSSILASNSHLLPTVPAKLGTAIPAITCTTPRHSSGNSTLSITSGGQKRTFLIHLPPSYGRQPQPLVINYHAYSMIAQQMANYTNMTAEADRAGFILIFPQGVDSPPSWNAGIGALGPTGDADDVQFTRDMLNYVENNYCVDPHRIYVTGYSLGGGIAYRVACTLSKQIAALATVAGAFYSIPGGCNPSRPLPILEIHGQADAYAPYNGNPARGMASVQAYLNGWIHSDRCDETDKVFFRQGDVTGIEWTHCADGVTIAHYRISDGGHTWPGAEGSPLGFTTHVIDANAVIWDFFSYYKS